MTRAAQHTTAVALWVGLFAVGGMEIAGAASPATWSHPLPGTVPGGGGEDIAKPTQCQLCHGKTPNGDADPYASWSGGMMSQSARDPLFLLALDIANQDIPGSGEFCIRCHAPRAWLGKRIANGDLHQADEEDMNGVSCDVCHRAVDPLAPEAATYAPVAPPGYGNAMMVIDPRNVVRGPYVVDEGVMPHQPVQDPFPSTSMMCGQCHDVSNPAFASDPTTQPPAAYGPLQRTFSEWRASDTQTLGGCQDCHMPTIQGAGQPARYQTSLHWHFASHEGEGGSVWQLGLTAAVWPTKVLVPAVDKGQARSRDILTKAADLRVEARAGQAVIRVTNKTGHKLPTGFPDGRRMWLHVTITDATGRVLDERGAQKPISASFLGKPVTVSDLADPSRTRVWEVRDGLSLAQAKKFARPTGPGYHLILNDTTVKDNRIPPAGFTNQAFLDAKAGFVGATYADGQNWDEFSIKLPPGAARVDVELLYQAVTWDYVHFLTEQARDVALATKVVAYWEQTGGCTPDVMGSAQLSLLE